MTHRPTSLRLALEHCPRAIDHMRAGTPRLDEDIFQAGIACHAILEKVGAVTWRAGKALDFDRVERIADKVVKALVTKGREFEGWAEPPMHPDHATKGRALALDYLAMRPIDPDGLERDAFEVGLAVTDSWEPAIYDSAWLRHIVDRVSIWTTESGARTVEVRDYKSAWSTGPDELHTAQRYVAVLLARATFPDADTYRRSVVNMRTREIHSADTDAEDRDAWRDMKAAVQAAIWYVEGAKRPDGTHAANPGAACFGCPYLLKCEAAADWLERALIVSAWGTKEQRAVGYAAAAAAVEALAKVVKAEAKDEPTPVPGGTVGWSVSYVNHAREDAYVTVADEAEICGMDTRSALRALDLTGRNLEQFAKAAPTLDTRDKRDEWLQPLREPKARRSFGVLPKKPSAAEETRTIKSAATKIEAARRSG